MLVYCAFLDFIEIVSVEFDAWPLGIITYFMYVVWAIPAIESTINYLEYIYNKDEDNENIKMVYWKLQSDVFMLTSICFFMIGMERLILYRNGFVVFLLVGVFFFILHRKCLSLLL